MFLAAAVILTSTFYDGMPKVGVQHHRKGHSYKKGSNKVPSATSSDYLPLDRLRVENACLPATQLNGEFALATKVGPTPPVAKYYELADSDFTLTQPWQECKPAVPSNIAPFEDPAHVSFCVKLAQPLDGEKHKKCWLMVTMKGKAGRTNEETYFIATQFPPPESSAPPMADTVIPITLMRPVAMGGQVARSHVDQIHNYGSKNDFTEYVENFFFSDSGTLDGQWSQIKDPLPTFRSQDDKSGTITYTYRSAGHFYAVYGRHGYHYGTRTWDVVCGVIRAIP